MSPWLLAATHLVAFFSGVGASWMWIRRKIQVREVEGHPALEYRHHPDQEETS